MQKALHTEFDAQRINAANFRKEFFKVTVHEVEEAVKRLAPDAEFSPDIEAQEIHETIFKKKKEAGRLDEIANAEFPAEI